MPSYSNTHTRLVRAFGSAKTHKCACGAQADEWAYQHTDPNPLVDSASNASGKPYSEDLDHYKPMCYGCHHKMDREWEGPKPAPVAIEPVGKEVGRKLGGAATSLLQRQCGGCERSMNPANLLRHQRATGHVGWVGV